MNELNASRHAFHVYCVIIVVVANDHIIRQFIGGGVFNAGIFKSSTCLKRHPPVMTEKGRQFKANQDSYMDGQSGSVWPRGPCLLKRHKRVEQECSGVQSGTSSAVE